MICERIADSLPEAVDGTDGLGPAERAHVETCLRCQAELVQYRKLLRAMHTQPHLDDGELVAEVLARMRVGRGSHLRTLCNRIDWVNPATGPPRRPRH